MARRGKKYVKLATGKKKDVEYTLDSSSCRS
jgi:hypothetical protein